MVWSDREETGFLSVNARERGVAVHILPTAQLYRSAERSLNRGRETDETRDRTIRKGPSISF